jgi:rifampicin phosphotransferase
MEFVAPLGAFGRSDLASAGGKGANLGELIRAGLPVPDGFVVTTDAYAEMVRTSGPPIDEHPTDDDGGSIRARFEAAEVPGAIAAAVAKAYAELGGGPVAVRSSATAEDLPGAAFAGQQDTYLNVLGEPAVLAAVRSCWASLWTDRAIAYRRGRGIESGEVRIAVVVQRMVQAETAGVMFTADPVSGDRERIVVDASSGLGEAVVSGLVTPDHYVLSPRGQLLGWSPGRREAVITGAAGGGTRLVNEAQRDPHRNPSNPAKSAHPAPPASEARTQHDPLPSEVLAELARLGTLVARHFGRPRDIEWAYADRRVYLVQARPMTALPPPPVRLNLIQRRMGEMLLEYVTVRPYPIDVTTWLPYGPVGMMTKVGERFGIRGLFANFLTEQDGVVYGMVPRTPRPTLGLLGTPFRVARLVRRRDPARWTEDPRFVEFLADVRGLADQDLSAMPWPRLIRVPRRALALSEPFVGLRGDYLPGAGVALLRLRARLARLGRTGLMSELILGGATRTEDANRALANLAGRLRRDPRLAAAVDTADPARLAEFPEFDEAFRLFLAEYGHRETASPILVTPPTWAEAPETVLGLIKVIAAAPPPPSNRAERALAELLSHPKLGDPRRQVRVRRLVERARAGIAFREDSHFYFTMPLPIVRRSLLEIGARLRDTGVLSASTDVFHLRLEELEVIADLDALPEPERRRLRSTVLARAAKRAELSAVRLLDPGRVYPKADRGEALVTGTPTSAGTVTGPVRVIREPAQFGKLRGGDVLVCPYTNPAWTPLFQRACAVVVDAGGSGSHAAIVAREYGIPAIMGTADGTTVLADGQLVTVDGNAGTVTAARPAPSTRGEGEQHAGRAAAPPESEARAPEASP